MTRLTREQVEAGRGKTSMIHEYATLRAFRESDDYLIGHPVARRVADDMWEAFQAMGEAIPEIRNLNPCRVKVNSAILTDGYPSVSYQADPEFASRVQLGPPRNG